MSPKSAQIVNQWFRGLNAGDMPSLLSLFSPSPRIRNAANPPLPGPAAPGQLLEEFFRRTCSRSFELLDMAESKADLFAAWKGSLTFPAGIAIGGIILAMPLTVTLRGVDRFRLRDGLITE